MSDGFRLAPDIYFDNYASRRIRQTKRDKFRRKTPQDANRTGEGAGREQV
jgi:hypothetical protein